MGNPLPPQVARLCLLTAQNACNLLAMANDAKLKIAYVLPQLNRAGTQKQVVQLAPAMADQGYIVMVVLLEEGRAMAAELSEKVEVVSCGFKDSPRSPATIMALFKLFRHLKKFRPDIIHSYLIWPNIWSSLVALFIPKAILITSRRGLGWNKEDNPWLRRLEDLTNIRASVVIANAKAVLADTEHWEPRARGKIRLIYNGFQASRTDPQRPTSNDDETRAKHGATADDVVLVCVANLHAYKGHADLIDAVSLLKERGRKVVLWILGEDRGFEQALLGQVRRLGLEKQVMLLGRRDDVETFLSTADIGLLCSTHAEGLSNSLLEYMNAGLPAVVTNMGGNAECVADGESGFVIPIERPDLLANCIDRMIESPSLRETFGAEAAARVRRLFQSEKMINEHIQLYSELTSG